MSAGDWLGLSGKVVAVTGGGRGIGRGIVEALLAVGAKVAVMDMDPSSAADLKDFEGQTPLLLEVDISDPESVEQAAEKVQQSYGPVYGLVNCAGIFRPGKACEMPLEDWDRLVNTNLRGTLICSRSFVPQMKQQGGGALVHIASVSGHFAQTNSGAYSASKAGILLLSKQLAIELSEDNIRSNAVCPGMIKTPQSEAFYQDQEITRARESMTASGRIGLPSDIANAVCFLLSEKAEYVNAAELSVDGGLESTLMHLIPRPGYNKLGAQQS